MERDLVIVGAGPAGIAAANAACEVGASVTLVDENPAPGGQIWRGSPVALDPQVELLNGCAVLDATGNKLWLENKGSLIALTWKRLILATGSRELFLPFPGWTLPGVVGVGGLQALSKSGLSLVGKRVVIAGSGPLLLAVASHAAEQGAEVLAVVEQAPLTSLARFGVAALDNADRRRQALGFTREITPRQIRLGWWVAEAKGNSCVQSVLMTNGVDRRTLEVDWLACSYGLVPNTDLARLLQVATGHGGIVVAEDLATSVAGVWAAGECTGIGGVQKSVAEGRAAGLAAAGKVVRCGELSSERQYATSLASAFRLRPEVLALADQQTTVCRCESVTLGEIRDCQTILEAKLQHRLGMGACQGRVCGPAVASLFGWGEGTIRPPLIPVTLQSLGQRLDF